MTDPPNETIVHRALETDREEPVVQIAEIVADLEDKSPDDLTTAYDQLDHILQHLFSTPPVPAAQVVITFSYEGYRITVEQNGRAEFVKTD